ncbi:hypothetical protein MY4038_010331 [Beauveria bassiana]
MLNIMYHKMLQYISVALAVLMNSDTATEIDRVLNGQSSIANIAGCYGPRYIGVPVDIGLQRISGDGLGHLLVTVLQPNDAKEELAVVDEIIKLLGSRSSPVIVLDGAMPKGGISETIDGKFGGIYGGGASTKAGSRNG